jgi:anti-anti-sigma regulatory factor
MKGRIDEATARGIKEAVRKAFEAEQAKIDAEHEQQVKRLLEHLDRFEGEAKGDRPA